MPLTNALQAVGAAGGTLIVEKGTYKITSAISPILNNDVEILFQAGSLIDASAVKSSNSGSILRLGGMEKESAPLSANAAKGDLSLKLSSMTAVPGELLLVNSTELWNPSRPYYTKGEIVEVEAANGPAFVLKTPLYDSYQASSTRATKLKMPSVGITGLNLVCNSNLVGLGLSYIDNLRLENCMVTGARETGIQLFYIYGGTVKDCVATDCWYQGSGTSYAPVCQFVPRGG